MYAVVGCLIGAAAGLGAWCAARVWFARHPARCGGTQPASTAALHEWRGALLWAAGLALWGGYSGWQAAHIGKAALSVLFAGLLLLICVVDLRAQRIPDLFLALMLGLALVQALCLGRPAPAMALAGLVTGGALFYTLSLLRRGALGRGDIRLAAALGAMLGLPDILPALAAGIFAGGAGALWLNATRRAGRRDRMAYAPYLALGAWLVWTRSLGLWP